MVFSSHIFLYYFLPAAILLYALSPPRVRAFTITLTSCVFYGWAAPRYLVLMFAATLMDYLVGGRIVAAQARGKTGKRWLMVSMVGNLTMLGFFKYADFFISTANGVLGWLGRSRGHEIPLLNIVLPVGISFYTFQTMSYTIDLYRREVPPARSFLDFAAFVSMFPQLVAGPIVRYSHLAEQLVHRDHTLAKVYQGILFIELGLAKKILIADVVAGVADQAFAAHTGIGPLDAWIGILAYAFQIYFDFSGYSDMAIGLALLLGFKCPVNFDQPYRSLSITEFWRRWHITLSTWLRDYLYIPLGGNRHGRGRTYVNLALTMLLGGLWHGAAWNFVMWGAWQGFWLIAERLVRERSPVPKLPRVVRFAFTFGLVLIGWVFFRAPSMAVVGDYLRAMFGIGGEVVSHLDIRPIHQIAFLGAAIATWTMPTTQAIVARAHVAFVTFAQPAFALALLHLHFEDYVPFLYFRF